MGKRSGLCLGGVWLMTLYKFVASWCGPCKKMSPIVEQIVADHGLKLVVIDIDEDQETALRYAVQGVPTLLLMNGADVIARMVGAKPKRLAERELGLA